VIGTEGLVRFQKFATTEALKPGKYTPGMKFTRSGAGPNRESLGTMKLYINYKLARRGR
jgi:arylsulfatase